jgi:hypothetical protein
MMIIPGRYRRFATANPFCGGLTINAAPLALRQFLKRFWKNNYCMEFIRSPIGMEGMLAPTPHQL